MIGKAIFERLTETEAVSALVGTRIFPELSPKQKDYPVIIYDIEDGEDEGEYDGASGLTQFSVTIVCVARSIPDVTALAAAVRGAIEDESGTWAGIEVDAVFVDRVRDNTLAIGEAQSTRFQLKEIECTWWAKV